MPIDNCRVCGQNFFPEPLLRYENMPKSAQYLPDAAALKTEKGITLEVCQCSGCGLVQLSNEPVPYYREVIRAAAFSAEMKEFRLRQFEHFVQKYSLKGKKVIEIGCGRGEYLSLMRQFGIDAYGLEYAEDAVNACIKNGLKVSRMFLENGDDQLNDAPFDAFFILNFFEHLPDPNSTLRGIANNLTDDGIGLVEVPNFDMMLRNNHFSEFITDHLFYFTKETLITTLRQNGFEVIECTEVWHDYIISAVVKKARKPLHNFLNHQKKQRLDLTHFYEAQARLKGEIEEYVKRFQKVAVWGAGHQAFAIFSLINLSEKIKYVVDSAPFKQYKYTPGTHIPIVPPDALNYDPVDAVIIMAASYSDEIKNIMRQQFDKNINVAILRDFGLEVGQVFNNEKPKYPLY